MLALRLATGPYVAVVPDRQDGGARKPRFLDKANSVRQPDPVSQRTS